MKREQKAQSSKENIRAAALAEFGTKSYDAASMNAICNGKELSKGLIYHYFGSKDALYLCSVQQCFDTLTAFLAQEEYDFSNFHKGMKQYLARRLLFFHTYPHESYLFFDTAVRPPAHLKQQLQALRTEFDAQCLGYYQAGLRNLTLRQGVTEHNALEYFTMVQDCFNAAFQRQLDDGMDFAALMRAHETQLSTVLNLMLYGIAKENTK